MSDNQYVLLQSGGSVRIVCYEQENSAVQHAVSNLMKDLTRVCDCKVVPDTGMDTLQGEEKKIWIGTFDIIRKEGTDAGEQIPLLEKLLDDKGKIRWEAYVHQVIGNTLYIVGADRRGTVFGIYDLCEQMGVSPWHFWADVPVKKRDYFALPHNYQKVDWPDVAYRGIFLNDEEELEAWAKIHTKDNTIGPETYAHIFELLLRLKGNYIWPAMHVNYFNENPQNGKLAEEMGVVVGTSHCDMLLRSNQNEWRPWLAQKGYRDVRYDYSIPGTNREIIQEYWKECVEMNRRYEVCYTMGMRGIHDSGFITETIDGNEALRKEEKTKEKIKLLEKVITDQRKIIKDVLGEEKGNEAVQTFIPYKEVLDLYDGGLAVPDDVTLIWVDDNFGYMRRYPNERERGRKGGNGLYYHASYWAFPGMSYLFFNSIPLAQTGNELKKCWESGIQKMWVLNVGALKPLEMDTEFFLRYAWEAGREKADTKDVSLFVTQWINQNFSGNNGQEAADIYNRFAQLLNVCKLEHMQSHKFSQEPGRDEAGWRLAMLQSLAARGETIYQSLPCMEQDAFFELFLMKLQAAYYINASFYYADRSRLLWKWGGMQAADAYVQTSREMDKKKQQMLYYYNHKLAEGKWNGILTPESFSPPPTILYPAGKPALQIGNAALGAVWEEDMTFAPHGKVEKTVILFNRGCGSVNYTMEAPEYLSIDRPQGSVTTETVITLRLREEYETACFETGCKGEVCIIGENRERYVVDVEIKRKKPYPQKSIAYYVEADGCVSMPADGYTRCINTEKAAWRRIPFLGRGCGDAMEAYLPCRKQQNEDTMVAGTIGGNTIREISMGEACLEYNFLLEHSGSFSLEIHRYLTLHPIGSVRMAVAVDERNPVLVESETVDEWKGEWKKAVMNDGEKLSVSLPYLEEGLHVLKIYPVDSYVTLHKFVIYTSECGENNLGPFTSALFDGRDWHSAGEREGVTLHKEDKEALEQWENLYGNPTEEELLLPMLYADADFWKTDRLYICSDEKPNSLGNPKYTYFPDGKKDVFCSFGEGIFMEKDGKIAIEAEYALENTENAYLTADAIGENICWEHTQSQSNGRTGLAMMVEQPNLFWAQAKEAPGMHYRMQVHMSGQYMVWLLMKFEDAESDACRVALDGTVVDVSEMYSANGNFFTYSMKQRWHWRAVCTLDLNEGTHTLSIYAGKSGLRIDRIYMSLDKEWPPIDRCWQESMREATAALPDADVCAPGSQP